MFKELKKLDTNKSNTQQACLFYSKSAYLLYNRSAIARNRGEITALIHMPAGKPTEVSCSGTYTTIQKYHLPSLHLHLNLWHISEPATSPHDLAPCLSSRRSSITKNRANLSPRRSFKTRNTDQLACPHSPKPAFLLGAPL